MFKYLKVIIETGNKHGFQLTNEARDYLIQVNFLIRIKFPRNYKILEQFLFKYCNNEPNLVEENEKGYIFGPVWVEILHKIKSF